MNNTFKKKGAVEMSLNLIIMLIIGMVVLGLVIGFVNSLVSKGVEGFDDQIGENQQLKLNDVEASPDNLAFLPSPSVDVKIGDKTNVFIKVRSFGSALKCNPGDLLKTDQPNTCLIKYSISSEDGSTLTAVPLSLTGPGFDAKNGAEDSKMYTLKTTAAAKVGTYYLTVHLYTTGSISATSGNPVAGFTSEESKTLTVTVK
jgi:hypothetical protein